VIAGFSDQADSLDSQTMALEANSFAGPPSAGSTVSGDRNYAYQGMQAFPHNMQAGLPVNNYPYFGDPSQAYPDMQPLANDVPDGLVLNNHAYFTDPNLAYQGMQALSVPAPNQFAIPCTQFGCFVTFKRDTDRIRHKATVHGINQALHLCQVPGCPKGHVAPSTENSPTRSKPPPRSSACEPLQAVTNGA
jgi:hypothetical protein